MKYRKIIENQREVAMIKCVGEQCEELMKNNLNN